MGMTQALTQRVMAHSSKILLVSLLAVPAVLSFSGKEQAATENRTLATFPAKPRSRDAILKYPAQLDAWINDHFGFRQALVKLNNKVRYALFGQFPTIQVIAGKNGRIFLSAHSADFPPYGAINLPCGYQFSEYDKIAMELTRFHAAFREMGIDAKLLIAPSSPLVYAEELPDWLAKRCLSSVHPFDEIMKPGRLEPFVRAATYYPLDEMRALKPIAAALPKTWFHWAGDGAQLVAQKSVEYFWKTKTEDAKPLVTKVKRLPSDLAHMFPGVSLPSDVTTIDFAASGIDECVGGRCFPEAEDVMNKLGDVSRYRNEKAPKPKLILVTDSFGHYIAGWYSRYYRDVLHISTNSADTLSDAEKSRLRQLLLEQARTGDVLFVYHDGGVLSGRIGLDQNKLLQAPPQDGNK
jgi:hypothetical protein